MNEYQKRFIALLRTIFELDKSDLDFGIYRIINIRQREIKEYFENRLPKKITEILAPFASAGKDSIRQKMTAIENEIALLGMTVNSLPDNAPKKQEYGALQNQLAQSADISALESDVYSALFNFFNRYYDEGDFISKRRYKEGVYAIPYEGEEVKLYWANQDQYYIKTSENFKDYTFTVDDITVHLRLVDATTEQNNNKETEDSKRAFMLYTESDERSELRTFEWNDDKKEFIIRFIYNVPEDKKKKYYEDNLRAIRNFLADYSDLMRTLLQHSIPGDPKSPSVIEKHLKAYVAKNTFDYFIHKDLGGFLNRELDFFIKNEIMHLDDLDTDDERRAETYLAKVRAVKRIGKEIIAFLAQIENFQRKLWLKKKFVVETNWCITLDRIDESFYPEILACQKQVQEWIDMYRVDLIEGDLTTPAFTNPPTMEFLRANQNLIVDTANFPTTFRDRLIASIDNLDENTGGLMINGDNFQTSQSLLSKNREQVKCLYLDPPYNTNEVSFLYKNNYKHSSWASMMFDRVLSSFKSLSDDGVLMITIDDEEVYNLKEIVDTAIGADKYIGTIVIQSNPRGRGINSYFATSHEYCICYAKDPYQTVIINQDLTDEQIQDFGGNDETSAFRLLPFRRSGGWSTPKDRPNSEFPLFFNKSGVLFAVGGERTTSADDDYKTNEVLTLKEGNVERINYVSFLQSFPNCIKVMPVDVKGLRRVWRWSDREKILQAGLKKEFVLKNERGYYTVQLKDRIKDGRKPKTIWLDSKYDSSSHGTNLLKNILGGRNLFGFPKSVYSTQESLHAIVGGEGDSSTIFDMFSGSGTTGHAVINLNREDGGNRRYILVEMGEYFDSVTKPRIKKVLYTNEWRDAIPQRRDDGVSHIMKYMRLESYEDALSNVSLEKNSALSTMFSEQYLINYMLDIEAKGSLLNLDAFTSPFDYKMKITEKNECCRRGVDVVETFNYLIGLTVASQSAIAYFKTCTAKQPSYEGAVDLVKDNNGEYAFRQIEGALPDGRRALVIWRNIKADNLAASNAALDAYFSRYRINPQDREFDVIFVNGDSNVENLRLDNETWKVVRTETEFNRLMWTE